MITEAERTVLDRLRELDSAVKSMAASGNRPDLVGLFARIDQAALALPPETAPDLLHFLRKKSYEKARLWLEGRADEIGRGSCLGD
ncbi:MAG TPA: hypothetical protein GYA07_09085 [Verrucomicrobia bacterium]|nr:hypothetical protein [Verrucomicrobiota bacterium]HOB31433.1 hypothetical protein [Verrucomicrobiota bacterium]HOP97331.1 hypothetical protein [Verrucomicrobiota bacterium]HPU54812.1 hypothetical protein [Verrucomicrobiota bacterium]